MGKKELAENLIDFCAQYNLFDTPKEIFLAKDKVVENLGDICFVESVIHTLILKAKYIENVDFDRLKMLLIELEKVRLDLEYDMV